MKIVNAHLRRQEALFTLELQDGSGKGGVKMDMRLDEGRDRQPTLGVDIPGVGGPHRGGPTMKIVNAHLRRQEALFTLELQDGIIRRMTAQTAIPRCRRSASRFGRSCGE
jgi:hypothetical protein